MNDEYNQLKKKILEEKDFLKANEIYSLMLKKFNRSDDEIREHMADILDQPIEENYYIRKNK